MSRLLRDKDYEKSIEAADLSQLTNDNQQTKLDFEQAAQAEMRSYLKQRYDVDKIFVDTQVFAIGATYTGGNLVEYTETAFDEATAYSLDDRVSYKGKIYKALGATTGFLPTDTANWAYVCDDLDLFYLTLPNPNWDPITEYSIGDIVFRDGSNYTAVVANTNIKPESSTAIWGTASAYTVTGVLPTDTTKWTAGDNRNQLLVKHLLTMTIFFLHERVTARVTPIDVKERYDGNSAQQTGGAIGWLKMVASGRVNADIIELIPDIGLAIQGGNALDVNSTTRTKRDNQLW